MNMLGYADNEASKILGIPVGTPSASFSMQEAGLTGQYKGQKTQQAQQADQAAYQFERQYGLSVDEALGSINGNPTLQAMAQQIQNAQFQASQAQNQSQFTQGQAQQESQFSRNLAADQANQSASRAASSARSSASPKPTVGQLGNQATADAIDDLTNDAPNMTRSELNNAYNKLKSSFIRDGADLKLIQEAMENVQTSDEIATEQASTQSAAQANEEEQGWANLPWWQKATNVIIPGDPYSFK
jgi:hypothetical protein